MRDTYSLYETKARLSAIIRQVREGHRVIVTLHGTQVAEIRPVEEAPGGLAGRLAQLADRGREAGGGGRRACDRAQPRFDAAWVVKGRADE